MKIIPHLVLFACNVDIRSRILRIILGVLVNIGTLFIIEHVNALVFWSLIMVSYVLLLEAFWGISLLHTSIIKVRKDDTCTICQRKKGE